MDKALTHKIIECNPNDTYTTIIGYGSYNDCVDIHKQNFLSSLMIFDLDDNEYTIINRDYSPLKFKTEADTKIHILKELNKYYFKKRFEKYLIYLESTISTEYYDIISKSYDRIILERNIYKITDKHRIYKITFNHFVCDTYMFIEYNSKDFKIDCIVLTDNVGNTFKFKPYTEFKKYLENLTTIKL